MDKIDFVNYRALMLEVRQLRSCLAALESSLDAIPAPRYSSTPRASHSRGSAIEARVARLVEVQALYRSKLEQQLAQLQAVEEAIGSLENPAERLVMRLRYVEGRSWVNVCMLLQPEGYSERQVYRLHSFALSKLKEV